jgi:hypothetical protein
MAGHREARPAHDAPASSQSAPASAGCVSPSAGCAVPWWCRTTGSFSNVRHHSGTNRLRVAEGWPDI